MPFWGDTHTNILTHSSDSLPVQLHGASAGKLSLAARRACGPLSARHCRSMTGTGPLDAAMAQQITMPFTKLQ